MLVLWWVREAKLYFELGQGRQAKRPGVPPSMYGSQPYLSLRPFYISGCITYEISKFRTKPVLPYIYKFTLFGKTYTIKRGMVNRK